MTLEQRIGLVATQVFGKGYHGIVNAIRKQSSTVA
jgi:hypothetical protein